MPIVIPSYNGARKQANLTPLLAMLLHKLGFPVVVHGVSEDPTRVITETIFALMGIEPTRHAGSGTGEARRPSTGLYSGWRAVSAAGTAAEFPLAAWRAQQCPYAGEACHAV
ncbi:hypothetical protein ACLK1Y_04395 [Escherichia coli]